MICTRTPTVWICDFTGSYQFIRILTKCKQMMKHIYAHVTKLLSSKFSEWKTICFFFVYKNQIWWCLLFASKFCISSIWKIAIDSLGNNFYFEVAPMFTIFLLLIIVCEWTYKGGIIIPWMWNMSIFLWIFFPYSLWNI